MSNNLLYKYNTKICIIQYIYKYMKKRLLIENDVNEMTDFQKILLLNKRKLSPDDVEFKSSDYKIDLNKVQIKPDGLLFDFDDLEQFLKFFHYPAFEDGTDGEWDATNYDRIYYGSYDFYNECLIVLFEIFTSSNVNENICITFITYNSNINRINNII